MTKQPKQKFAIGDIITIKMLQVYECEIKDVKWNGFTWLYELWNNGKFLVNAGEAYLTLKSAK